MTAARYLLHCCLSDAPVLAQHLGCQLLMEGCNMDGPSGDTTPFGRRKNLVCGEQNNYREQNASFLRGISDFQLKIGCSVSYAILKSFKKGRSSN